MLQTIERMRKTLGLNRRLLKGDQRSAVGVLETTGGKRRSLQVTDRRRLFAAIGVTAMDQ